MVQLVKCLLCKHKDLNLDPVSPHQQQKEETPICPLEVGPESKWPLLVLRPASPALSGWVSSGCASSEDKGVANTDKLLMLTSDIYIHGYIYAVPCAYAHVFIHVPWTHTKCRNSLLEIWIKESQVKLMRRM